MVVDSELLHWNKVSDRMRNALGPCVFSFILIVRVFHRVLQLVPPGHPIGSESDESVQERQGDDEVAFLLLDRLSKREIPKISIEMNGHRIKLLGNHLVVEHLASNRNRVSNPGGVFNASKQGRFVEVSQHCAPGAAIGFYAHHIRIIQSDEVQHLPFLVAGVDEIVHLAVRTPEIGEEEGVADAMVGSGFFQMAEADGSGPGAIVEGLANKRNIESSN